MIPIHDESPKGYHSYTTYILILGNIVIFFFVQPGQAEELRGFFLQYGLVPVQIFRNPGSFGNWTDLITSLFIHADPGHLFGNMIYLWIFGDNIEYRLGHLKFFFFYLIIGIMAAGLHVHLHQASSIPLVGASGAISGVLGAYLIAYPKNKITLLFIFMIIRVRALYVLGFWFLYQTFNAMMSSADQSASGIAWLAHISGFMSGLVIYLFLPKAVPDRKSLIG